MVQLRTGDHPETFLFFYYRGHIGEVVERAALREGHTARCPLRRRVPLDGRQVLEMAQPPNGYRLEAEKRHTDERDWYERQIEALNREYLGSRPAISNRAPQASAASPVQPPAPRPVTPPSATAISAPNVEPRFPMVDLDRLLSSPKARKREDLQRILTSRQSEDYVT